VDNTNLQAQTQDKIAITTALGYRDKYVSTEHIEHTEESAWVGV